MYHHPFPLKKRSNFGKSKAIFVFVGIILGILIFSYIGYKNDVNKAVDPSDETTSSFIIKKGESIKTIGKNLEEKGLIKDSFSFYLYVKMNDFDKKILAGRFLLSKSMPLKKIVEDFTNMKKAEFLVTIQEGLRIVDIDKKLVELELLQEGEFMQAAKNFNGWEYYPFLDKKILSKLAFPVEGYIYPDTYFIDPSNFKPHTLIYLALDNFEKKTANLIPQIKNHTVHEIITMASIIETEVFGKKDRKLVSGILWKRLANNWTIGADITLLYTKSDRKITKEDLNSDSPYNTRKNLGLPPGPIGNPSLESIEASMFPESSSYWFYLTKPKSGEVVYSKTNEEHNINRAKYL